jgi:arginine-tRNA-protein transferase
MTVLSRLKVFATHPHDCSYLPSEQATTLFIDPAAHVDVHLYSQLSELGFRRSGPHLYRPHCAACDACIPARLPAAAFSPSRQQRRIWQKNQDLRVEDRSGIDGDEFYSLYARYIEGRHRDGDMYPPSRQQFDSFLTGEWNCTHFCCFYAESGLVAVAVVDIIDNGVSAIYTFFDPDQASRSLGTFAILWQVELARRLGLGHVYLGYWVRQCRKMAYKTKFRPVELLLNGRWLTLT